MVRTARGRGRAAVRVFACDAGSQSFKAALYDISKDEIDSPSPGGAVWAGSIAWEGSGENAVMREGWAGAQPRELSIGIESPHRAPERLIGAAIAGQSMSPGWQSRVDAAAHRIVHAADVPLRTSLIDADLRTAIVGATPLAPGHNPLVVAAIDAARHAFGPAAHQVAVFDSTFHSTMPDAATTYAVPKRWREVWQIRKLGFHGISHRYCARRAAHVLGRDPALLRTVTCHLGGGSSLAAVDRGRSVDTTMGWTTLDGLVMGERSGSIDPGAIVYLLRRQRYSAEEMSRELNERSGLLGLSGISSDMRDIVRAMQSGSRTARLAFDVYTHRLRAGIAAMAASMGGLDAIAFTGGIGENSADVRRAACDGLGFLDIAIDSARDAASDDDRDVAPPSRRVRVVVVRSQERWALASECARFLASRSTG
jgi:acetate kinase